MPKIQVVKSYQVVCCGELEVDDVSQFLDLMAARRVSSSDPRIQWDCDAKLIAEIGGQYIDFSFQVDAVDGEALEVDEDLEMQTCLTCGVTKVMTDEWHHGCCPECADASASYGTTEDQDQPQGGDG